MKERLYFYIWSWLLDIELQDWLVKCTVMKEAMGILDGVCHAMGVMDGIFGESKNVLDVIFVSPKLS